MYQIERTVVLSKIAGSVWQDVDASKYKLKDLFYENRKIYFELSNPLVQGRVILDAYTLIGELLTSTMTMQEWLVSIGNRSLSGSSSMPNLDVRYATYSDLFMARYKAVMYNRGFVTPPQYSRLDYKDVKITRPNFSTDMTDVHDNVLFSINGYYHYDEMDGNNVCILDGGVTVNASKQSQAGMLSFKDIGKIKKERISPLKISSSDQTAKLKDKIYFTIDTDVSGKSFFLVLGGYLIIPDSNSFYQINSKSFILDLNRLNYIERLYESRNYLDLSFLELWDNQQTPNTMNVDKAWSDSTITKYMTLSQSFMVIVDVPSISFSKVRIRKATFPGHFETYQEPNYPLQVGYGRSVEYWKINCGSFWSVTANDNFSRNYLFGDRMRSIDGNVNAQINLNKPSSSQGDLLVISTMES